jgi:hypothetical protein
MRQAATEYSATLGMNVNAMRRSMSGAPVTAIRVVANRPL